MKEKLIGKKTGICEKCGKFVDVDVVQVDKAIYYVKKCKTCDWQRTKISVDIDYYFEIGRAHV